MRGISHTANIFVVRDVYYFNRQTNQSHLSARAGLCFCTVSARLTEVTRSEVGAARDQEGEGQSEEEEIGGLREREEAEH